MNVRIFLFVTCFSIMVKADSTNECLKLLVGQGPYVEKLSDTVSRIYTQQGYFDFKQNSKTCPSFNNSKSIYDKASEIYSIKMGLYDLNYGESVRKDKRSGDRHGLDSLEIKVNAAHLRESCLAVENQALRSKIVQSNEKLELMYLGGNNSKKNNTPRTAPASR